MCVGGTCYLSVIALCSTGIPRDMNYSVFKVRFDTGFLIIFNPLYCLQIHFKIQYNRSLKTDGYFNVYDRTKGVQKCR